MGCQEDAQPRAPPLGEGDGQHEQGLPSHHSFSPLHQATATSKGCPGAPGTPSQQGMKSTVLPSPGLPAPQHKATTHRPGSYPAAARQPASVKDAKHTSPLRADQEGPRITRSLPPHQGPARPSVTREVAPGGEPGVWRGGQGTTTGDGSSQNGEGKVSSALTTASELAVGAMWLERLLPPPPCTRKPAFPTPHGLA